MTSTLMAWLDGGRATPAQPNANTEDCKFDGMKHVRKECRLMGCAHARIIDIDVERDNRPSRIRAPADEHEPDKTGRCYEPR